MELVELAKPLIEKHEGRVSKVYDDATGGLLRKGDVIQGYPTIGIGRNLSGNGLSSEEIDYLFANDVVNCISSLEALYPWFSKLDLPRQVVLIDMRFQLGLTGLSQFHQFLKLVEQKDYKRASIAMLESLWAKQTPKRALELAEIMATGTLFLGS